MSNKKKIKRKDPLKKLVEMAEIAARKLAYIFKCGCCGVEFSVDEIPDKEYIVDCPKCGMKINLKKNKQK
jgi:DNA-directed RNA polymerase subunit RPC12/RpoP